MREMLFRGRPVSVGEYFFFSQIWKDNCKDDFVYGSLVVDNDRYYISVSAMRNINVCVNNGTTSMIEVMPETVCQFTGLLDKNGKKIFESDIVLRSGIAWLIAFEKNAFVCKDSSMETYFALWEQWEYNWKSAEDISPSDAFEVIGNIYNNPELLV